MRKLYDAHYVMSIIKLHGERHNPARGESVSSGRNDYTRIPK
jgi:hypothetical protein